MPIFEPPTVEEGPAGGGPLFSRYQIPRGITVLKNAGVYTEHRYPTQQQVLDADIAYIGGYVYEVSNAESAALQDAGYTTTENPVLSGAVYGSGTYGTDTYGG